MGKTLVYGFLAAVTVFALLVWVLNAGIVILAPAMFWFVSLPLIATLAITAHSISQPLIKQSLAIFAVTSGLLFLTSGVFLLALAPGNI